MVHQRARDGGANPPDDPNRARRFGRYTLIKKIAMGGMAEIWLASQKGLADFNRFVVIKKILSHLSEQETFVQMFLDEARTCAQLTHPNVVQIYDLGRESNAYYIAMEYIAGENLSAIAWRGVKKQMPLPPAYAAKMIADAAKALHYAHQMRGANGQPLQIVHRDVSPQNILVTYEGEVKVVDFGIAKAASKNEHTKTGMLKGKFAYMSPEQCVAEPLDGRSDIFALGIVLYELVTGKRLFKHDSELMILEMIVKRPVTPPSEAAPGIPPKLDAIIMRSLEKMAEDRFQSAQEMQIALEDYLRDDPVNASSSEMASYMRALFHDKIEEKRKLIEAAAKNELPPLDAPMDGAPAPQTSGRGTQGGRTGAALPEGSAPGSSPRSMPGSMARRGQAQGSGVRVTPAGPAQTQPGQARTPHPYQSPSGMTAMPMTSATSYVGGFTNVLEPPRVRSWMIHLFIAFAAALIVGSAAILIVRSSPEPALVRRGSITLVTKPSGAKVFIDGHPLADSSGNALVTPVELKNLDYGSSYQIRLERADHKSEERALTMNDKLDHQELNISLEGRVGTIVASVVDAEPGKVEVYFGNERAGVGPMIKREHASGSILISAHSSTGRTCTAEPETVVLGAGATEVTTISCRRSAGGTRPPVQQPPQQQTSSPQGTAQQGVAQRPEGAAGQQTQEAPPPVVEKKVSGGCTLKAGAAPGFATINSTPYADLYIDGQKVGQTPLPKKQLPAGCVIIRAVNPDSGKEKTVRLEIQPGSVSIYDIEL